MPRNTTFDRLRLRAGGLSWQARKQNSACKADLIRPELERLKCRSVLDVGCNAGQVSRKLAEQRFVVGIDQKLDLRGFDNPFHGVALGQFSLTPKNAEYMPRFDAVLILSVHHQWYASRSEDEADAMFHQVFSIARSAVFVEFAALTAKYGNSVHFVDNDAASIQDFALAQLSKIAPYKTVKYLGSCPESQKEPNRFMFMIEK